MMAMDNVSHTPQYKWLPPKAQVKKRTRSRDATGVLNFETGHWMLMIESGGVLFRSGGVPSQGPYIRERVAENFGRDTTDFTD